jgi:hypothetical protein
MRLVHALIGALSFAVVPAMFAGVADAATTAPFFVTFTTRSTALMGLSCRKPRKRSSLGDTISFFWDWGDEGGLVDLTAG